MSMITHATMARKRIKPQCVTDMCNRIARSGSKHCIRHGGGRRCQTDGCKRSADATNHCVRHGGGRRCQTDGCKRSAEGSTNHCIRHGGGKRCLTQGCKSSARGSTNHCIRHGGGRRCQTEGCKSSAEGSTNHCVRHRGGRRCQTEGCKSAAQGSTNHCKAHGGGKRCHTEGCDTAAQGSTNHCKAHGGADGVRWMGATQQHRAQPIIVSPMVGAIAVLSALKSLFRSRVGHATRAGRGHPSNSGRRLLPDGSASSSGRGPTPTRPSRVPAQCPPRTSRASSVRIMFSCSTHMPSF